jgi:uncharacterized protein YyaL (SSP411 family)
MGFYCALNADSEGEEGAFYVFTDDEIRSVVGSTDYLVIRDYFGVKKEGNFEHGKNVLYKASSADVLAMRYNLSEHDLQTVIDGAIDKLLVYRNKRERPSTDDKTLTSWNALMLRGYVDAYKSTSDNRFLQMALKNGSFILTNMVDDEGHVWRNYKDGKATIDGFIDDYAYLIRALTELYQVTFDINWLTKAKLIITYATTHFIDDEGEMFFMNSDLSEQLVARKIETMDNVTPSPNALMAHNLLVLGSIFGIDEWLQQSEKMVRLIADKCVEGGPYYAGWDQLIGMLVYGLTHVVIMGDNALDLSLKLQLHIPANTIVVGGTSDVLPLTKNRLVEGKTLIYICKNNTCQLPVESVEEAMKLLKEGSYKPEGVQ